MSDNQFEIRPHGFVFSSQIENGIHDKVYEALLRSGFAPWDWNGLPLFVAFNSGVAKKQYFEAGFLAGKGVPVFLLGREGSFSKKHIELVKRFGGWIIYQEDGLGLLSFLASRGIEPTKWDLDLSPAFLERFLVSRAIEKNKRAISVPAPAPDGQSPPSSP